MTGHMHALLDATLFEGEKIQVRHLLSVFCDVQVELDSDMRIAERHSRLEQILAKQSLEGTSFCSMLVEADKQRFESFMHASTPLAFASCKHEQWQAFPHSLHVHMHGVDGAFVPMKLFHTVYPSLEGAPHHLLGICLDKESESLQNDWVGDVPQVSADMRSRRDDGNQQKLPAQVSTDLLVRAEDSVSMASSVTSSSFVGMQLPELEDVTVSIDAFSQDFTILSCQMNFQDPEEAEDLIRLPALAKWLCDRAEFEQLRDLALHHINIAAQDTGIFVPDLELGATKMYMPGQQDTFMHASSAKLNVMASQEEDADEGDNDCDAEGEELEVSIKFSGFSSHRRMPPRRFVGRTKGSRSRSDAAKPLPAINELQT